ncbi:VTC domain protein [Posidoniimonas corsicana]|uniref:VTC domain protein n=1 Tax=Posidoniimonas corsicana TaxID=1938618 RepID=A0A5C5V261_9BACT|nr:polyphosphate polymerase domain-containing protein [Posidoniimonas corsicana]TWT32491.1 VTC domain protein [Posidoniimonas corsicana]
MTPTRAEKTQPAPEIVQALTRLAPIDLSEMDSVSLMNRVDTKFVMAESTLLDLLDDAADDYRVLEVGGERLTRYSTLYFDTPALNCYFDHHNGKSIRRKFRMRAYGSSGASFFEVKQRTNKGRTDKRRIPINAITSRLEGESAALAEAIAGADLGLEARIWTEFSRITLVGRHAPERVTLDVDLQFRVGDRRVGLPGLVIAEVKQERDSRDSVVRRRLREAGVRPLRVSKYCLGSILLDPALKRNRFKPKLLAIQAYSPC